MLNTSVIVKFFQREINRIATEIQETSTNKVPIRFNLFPEFGEITDAIKNKFGDKLPSNLILSHLEAKNSEAIPVNGYVNVLFNFDLKMIVPVLFDNKMPLSVQECVHKFIETFNDTSHKMAGGYAHITFQTPELAMLNPEVNIGDGSIMFVPVQVNFTRSGSGSAHRKHFINDMELPYLRATTIINRTGGTMNMAGYDTAKTISTQQTKLFSYELPFDKDNPACVMIQSDILSGNLGKTYKRTFYTTDGSTIYTQENPLVEYVQLFNNAEDETVRTMVASFSVTFAPADTVSHDGLRYYMALIDTPFDASTQNTRMFEDLVNPFTGAVNTLSAKENQQLYYEQKVITQGGYWKQIKAPNLNNLTSTQQVFFNDGFDDVSEVQLTAKPITEIMQKNFAIIKVVDWDENVIPEYFYYVVNSATMGAADQALFDLEIEDVQTYLF